jgi:hypothetical protein
MDIYSFVYDQSLLNFAFTLVTLFGLLFLLSKVAKRLFDRKWALALFLILYFAIRIAIVQVINSHTNKLFVQSEIHSVVTDQIEWRTEAYRYKLKRGIDIFDSEDQNCRLQIGDSIVKEANTDSFYVYRKDTQIGIYQLVSRRKY